MDTDLGSYRKSYEKQELLEEHVSAHPMDLFQQWFHEVDDNFDVGETNAMTLSTIGLDGFPKSRVVLLKKYDTNGFVFYTNYESDKGKAILANPNVCISFFWPAAERQIIIKGKAEKIASHLSDAYFKSRPRGSQLGALVSKQSEILNSREDLKERLDNLELTFKDKDIQRPAFWGGFIVKPYEVEFWQGRPNRLHDRLRYKRDASMNWILQRLSP